MRVCRFSDLAEQCSLNGGQRHADWLKRPRVACKQPANSQAFGQNWAITNMKNFSLLGIILLATAGCSTTVSRNPVPEKLVSQAEVPGYTADRLVQQTDEIKLQQFDGLLGDAVTRAKAADTNRPLTQLAL